MLRATVTGSVWSTRRLESLPPGALLEVRTDDGATLIAFDVLGTGLGERFDVNSLFTRWSSQAGFAHTGQVAALRLPNSTAALSKVDQTALLLSSGTVGSPVPSLTGHQGDAGDRGARRACLPRGCRGGRRFMQHDRSRSAVGEAERHGGLRGALARRVGANV